MEMPLPMFRFPTSSVLLEKAIGPWSIFFFSIAIQLIAFDKHINLYDEGIILYGGERVFYGDVPYKDFWTMYGPAQFYVTSLLYHVFGVSDLVVRIFALVIKAAIPALSYLILSRFSIKSIALGAALAILLLLIGVRQDLFPVFPAIAFALASIVLFDMGCRRGSGFLFLSGVCTGISTTFRHDLGFYNAIAILGVMFFLWLRTEKRWSYKTNPYYSKMTSYAIGVLVVFAPVTIALLSQVSVRDLYLSLIAMPASIYSSTRSLPFPNVNELASIFIHPSKFTVYVPFITVIWFVLMGGYVRTKQYQRTCDVIMVNKDWMLISVLLATCLIFTLKGIVRVSTLHMVQSLVISIILLAIGLSMVNWRSKREILYFAPGLFLSLFLIALPVFNGARTLASGIKHSLTGTDSLVSLCITPPLQRLRCVTADNDYLMAAKFVRDHSRKDDLIYVGTTRHDRIFVNAVAFYFMAERHSVTKWHELHPGVQTTSEVQQDMVREMEANPVRFVIADSRWNSVKEPNKSSLSSGVSILDDYIREQFHEVQRFGTVHILAATEE